MSQFTQNEPPFIEQLLDTCMGDAGAAVTPEECLARAKEILDICWSRILPTLGRVTVTTVFERAIIVTQAEHGWVVKVTVTPGGLAWEEMHRHAGQLSLPALQAGLKALIQNLIYILTLLTGEILTRQIECALEGKYRS